MYKTMGLFLVQFIETAFFGVLSFFFFFLVLQVKTSNPRLQRHLRLVTRNPDMTALTAPTVLAANVDPRIEGTDGLTVLALAVPATTTTLRIEDGDAAAVLAVRIDPIALTEETDHGRLTDPGSLAGL